MLRIPKGKMYFDIYDSCHFPYGTHCFYTVISGHKTSLADFTGITRVEHGSNHGEVVVPLPPRPGVLTLPSPPSTSSPLSPKNQGWSERQLLGGPQSLCRPTAKGCVDYFSEGILAHLGRGMRYGPDAPGQYGADPQSKVRHLPAAPTAGAPGAWPLAVWNGSWGNRVG